MWRIHFEPSVSKFVVQVLTFNFLWRTCQKVVKGLAGEPLIRTTPRLFGTYAEARKWVNDVGLSEAYCEQVPYSQNQLALGSGAR